ncbi:MAG: TetR/AcrR family transcriptional regulator [Anaeroplasmataceae bacterium]|nr:TetR/AcrR family transcriptional regulator [Anaeroplasmataceae bacterium]
MKEDLRIVKTKKALKNALLDLLKIETFEKINVSKICEYAKVNRVTFYSHYQDKYDLFQSYIEEIKNDILKTAYSTVSKIDSSIENLSHFFSQIFLNMIDVISKEREIIIHFGKQENSMLMYMINTSAYKSLKEVFSQLKNHFRLKYDEEYIISFIVGGANYMIHNWMLKDKMLEIEHLKKQINSFLNDLNKSELLFENMR